MTSADHRGGRGVGEQPATWRYGYELCQQLGLKAGSVYPIRMRLADRGLLETAWERDAPAGRPPRHLYRLTGPGLALDGAGPMGVGANLADAVWWPLTFLALWALPLGVLGAATGGWWTRRVSRQAGPRPAGRACPRTPRRP